jgi:hypothetical protein
VIQQLMMMMMMMMMTMMAMMMVILPLKWRKEPAVTYYIMQVIDRFSNIPDEVIYSSIASICISPFVAK